MKAPEPKALAARAHGPARIDLGVLDDDSLVRLIVRTEADALSELYERYGRLVFSLALHITGDPATAEEITQDVFVRIWERAAQYRPDEGSVRTWLTSIARHRAVDHLRRQGTRAEAKAVPWAAAGPEPRMVSDSRQYEVELAMLRARVRASLAELPEEQKQVLTLAYFRGYTQSEIATALGLPLGTVKTRIRLAMEKLRALLHDEI